jgi:ankyrin repeat protein
LDFHDANGSTPLIEACLNSYVDMVEILLSHGASVNFKNKIECTSLIELAKQSHRFRKQCVHSNYKQIVECLLEQRIDVDSRDSLGNTALIYASKSGDEDLVELLIHYGANLDLKGQFGNTALYEASSYGHLNCVKVLIESGANMNLANVRNVFPLGAARMYNRLHVEEYLTRHQIASNKNKKVSYYDLINNLYLTLETLANQQELCKRVIESFDEKTFLITKAHLEALEQFGKKSNTHGLSALHLNMIKDHLNPANFILTFKEKIINCIRKQHNMLEHARIRIFNCLEKSIDSLVDKCAMRKRLEHAKLSNESLLSLKELNKQLSEENIQDLFRIEDTLMREQQISNMIKNIEFFQELVEKKLKLTRQFFDIAEEKHFLFKIKPF